MCAFGEQMRDTLTEPLLAQLADYHLHCENWPHEEENPRLIAIYTEHVHLEGWLGGLRRPAEYDQHNNEYARIELLPGKIHTGDDRRWHRLLRPWVQHVLINAMGTPTQTLVIAQESSIVFASISTDSAMQIARDWLAAWQNGLDTPLPVALKTALNFLKHQCDDKAKAVYEGGYNSTGDVQKSAALARQFPTFADLQVDGAFNYWAHELYSSLFNAHIINLTRQGESL